MTFFSPHAISMACPWFFASYPPCHSGPLFSMPNTPYSYSFHHTLCCVIHISFISIATPMYHRTLPVYHQ